MKKALINQIISLREKRKIIEAELGLSSENTHIFSKEEMLLIKQDINNEKAYKELEDINLELINTEDQFFKEYSETDGSDRTERWNKEFEGMINQEIIRKIYE
ncbi:hypothetical protein [Helicovermis profundi]|uniref:Uncharacterized protein n=1 Tax=Helicovermis profundi TaxID=3065157 RepID=A0AAU9E3E0_9FIRM|nr:hypothetical protein HLPR_07560 [Clostridia bacterium S502]